MLIRRMQENEIDFVRKQRLNCYKSYQNLVSKEHWAALKGTLSSDNDVKPGVDIFVMEAKGRIAGSVVLFPAKLEAYEWTTGEQNYPEIRMLAVEPSMQRSGIGKLLITHCIQAAKEKGYSHVGLHTADFMNSAISLYKKIGFERVRELDFEPANDGVMVKGFKISTAKTGNEIGI